jgi:hypothetical protein
MSIQNKELLKEMHGQTFIKVTATDTELHFVSENETYVFGHIQDCCEIVYIEEIIGDLTDLEKFPLVICREDSQSGIQQLGFESLTYTFYNFATLKGYVTVRFLGSSNGYYSEEVDIWKVTQ